MPSPAVLLVSARAEPDYLVLTQTRPAWSRLILDPAGKASLTMMGQNEQCTYDVSGKNLTLTCGGDKTVWGIHDDGSLTGPGFVGTLAKRKS